MTLGLFPQETQDGYDALQRMSPAGPLSPTFFAGAGTSIATGVGEGALKTAAPLVEESGVDLAGALSPSPDFYTAQPPKEQSQDEIDDHNRTAVQAGIKQFASDPAVTGTAGQILHGVSSVGVRALAGSALAGPVGAAVVAGGTEGYSTSEELQQAGVDKNTAHALGAANALMTGIGVAAPGISGIGTSYAARMTSASVINTLFGAANRATMHTVLEDNGYDAMAQQYRVLDGQALASDAILGAAFGTIAHLHGPAPSTIDAAHTLADAVHVEQSADGVPTTPQARDLHVRQMSDAAEALFNDSPVTDMQMPDTVPNPAQDALHAAAGDALTETSREVTGEVVGPESGNEGQPERRADAQASLRMQELAARRKASGLSPEESDEYTQLLEADRLAGKVGGRVIPGVLNDVAYAEAQDRGELLPTQGYADMDMLKATNDTYGHTVGDQAIHLMGETLARYFPRVYKRSAGGAGDEFLMEHNSPEEHEAAAAKARQYLDNVKLRAKDAQGKVIAEKQGIGFSHGSGKTSAEAEAAGYADKTRRAAANLRSDRGPVAEGTGARRGKPAGSTPTGAKAVPVKSPVEAVSKLTQALKRLVATDGKDETAHATARGILEHAANEGWDADSLGRAAVARAGTGADRALAAASVHDTPAREAAGLDPETREAVEQAQRIVGRDSGLVVADEAGNPVAAHDALNAALDNMSQAKSEGVLHQIAAACFGRA